MNILMVCSEFAPLAKTGGLADAVTGLSDALARAGPRRARAAAEVRALAARGHGAQTRGKARHEAPLSRGRARAECGRGRASPRSTALGAKSRRGRTPRIYLLDLAELTPATSTSATSAMRAASFGSATRPSSSRRRSIGCPDILHCHDWHAALVPLVQRLRDPRRRIPTVLSPA